MSFHGAKAYNNAVVNWADQDNKAMPLNTEEWDTDAYHDNSTNNTRMTCPSGLDGYYFAHASTYISGTPAQDAPITIKKGGVVVRGSQVTPYTAQPAGVGGVGQSSCIVHLAAGEYIEAWLYVDNNGGGGTFPVGSASDPGLQMSLAIVWLGA